MPTCDEDDCTNNAGASCPGCGLFLCLDHGGGDGNECDQCGTPMADGRARMTETARAPQQLEMDGGIWGPLTIDREALLDALGEATMAVGKAVGAAQWRTAEGYPIGSPWADLLGGASQIIDAIIDLLTEDVDA